MAKVLMLLPERDYDPTEAAVPWAALRKAGHEVIFATPGGQPAFADPRMVKLGFGLLNPLLMTRPDGLAAYRDMCSDPSFAHPVRHLDWPSVGHDALLVPGGHAQGVKTLLESEAAQQCVVASFAANLPVAAICHGPVLLARSRMADGRSVLHGRKTAALTCALEYSGWLMTCCWLGRYYRTYPTSVQAEVSAALAAPEDFLSGPLPLRRDRRDHPEYGFAVRDGQYVSARWPGDSHAFAAAFVALLAAQR